MSKRAVITTPPYLYVSTTPDEDGYSVFDTLQELEKTTVKSGTCIGIYYLACIQTLQRGAFLRDK